MKTDELLRSMLCAIAALAAMLPLAASAFEPRMADSAVIFERGSAALDASERQQVVSYLLALKEMKFCPLQIIMVIGFADPTEGEAPTRQRLAELRAIYVADLLKRHGAPASVLVSAAGNEKQNRRAPGAWGGYVELAAQQTLRWTPCTAPVDSQGFYPDPDSRFDTPGQQ